MKLIGLPKSTRPGRLIRLAFAPCFVAVAAVCVAETAPTSVQSDQTNARVASYDFEADEQTKTYFAAAIQPSADAELIDLCRRENANVAIAIDTSASQTGSFRDDSLLAASQLIDNLPSDSKVAVYAVDVSVTPISDGFVSVAAAKEAVEEAGQRLPMGNTNLMAAIDTIRGDLVGINAAASINASAPVRSLVYIGDGTSLQASDDDTYASLLDSLQRDQVSVHSIAIGPAIHVDLLGSLANWTGGLVTAVGSDFPVQQVAATIASAAVESPIWIDVVRCDADVDFGMRTNLPLRLDRDGILIGTCDREELSNANATLRCTGSVASTPVTLTAEMTLEPSHPDFGFLVALVNDASASEGVRLPTAGSSMLRHMARVYANRSEEFVKAGQLSLQRGNRRGAAAIVDKAIQADPGNEKAKQLRKVIGDRLIIQNDGSLDDIFGGADDPFAAPAAGDAMSDDPFAAPADNTPAGDAAVEDPFAAPAATAPAPAAPAAPAAPRAAAPMVVQPPANLGARPVGDDDLYDAPGGLLGEELARRGASEGRLRAEVRATLREATRLLRSDPTGVSGSLKSLLARVETAPDVRPATRRELAAEVRSAIQIASAREAEYIDLNANLEQELAAANAQARLLAQAERRELTLETLSEQLNSLIDEGRYIDADRDVAVPFMDIAGVNITRDSVEGQQFRDSTLYLQAYARDRRARELRERNFVDAMSLVVESAIPFVDEPPVVYPDAEVWQRLSRRRLERYGSIELVGNSETERRIERALDNEVTQNFIDLPLGEAIRTLRESQDIPIIVDTVALEDNGLSAEDPVTIDLANVSLRSFLRLMLRQLDLTYMIKDEVMQITTPERAEENLITKVYPVGDLVVPIVSLGGGGGMGGGMGGGGMGGGGMGGGGMGGGGMGGGMGGGGMGGGGGMFVVPDDASPAGKRSVTIDNNHQADNAIDATEPAAAVAQQIPVAQRITVRPADGQSPADAWNDYFTDRQIDDAAALSQLDADVRRTVAAHSNRAKRLGEQGDDDAAREEFQTIRHIVAAAMRSGHVQPWMYSAYAIALQATDGDRVEIERSLLSAVDFADTPDDIMNVAGRLESIGSNVAALQLVRNVSQIDPLRREPYMTGLRLAEQLDDLDAMRWAVTGILGQAWPSQYDDVVERAKLVAKATHQRLVEEGRRDDANQLAETLRSVTSNDVVVRVSWTGDADIDVAVEEPSGTICAMDNISSPGGGTFMGDDYPSKKDDAPLMSETYVCPQGFSGRYRLLVRKVWGNVATGKVTVEILTDVGRPEQRSIKQQLPLTERDAMVIFEVKNGKRQDAVADAQLAHLRDVARDMRQEVLGQFNGPINEEIVSDLRRQIAAATGGVGNGLGVGNNGFLNRGAVGFRPELTVLPEGASLSTLAIISADRRYVRISPAPFFSQIGAISTFNFVTGEDGGGGAGGIGGGGGGLTGGAAAGGGAGGFGN